MAYFGQYGKYSKRFHVFFKKGKKSFRKEYRTYRGMKISIRALKRFGWKVEQTYLPRGYKNFGMYGDSHKI